ncbi:OmpA family protein [Lacibacter sp. MH-610]|uniref:OmpA family protein n=1 Tax=Lacibacter sp. MH-610 TaxID=3020883 RepID=UPI003892B1A3
MKHLASALCLLLFSFAQVNAQQPKTKKPAVLSFTLSFSDYNTPALIRDSSFSKAFKGTDWLNPGKKSFGIGVGWWKQLTPQIDFSANFNGTFSNFPELFVKDDSIGQAGFTPQLDAMVHLFAFKQGVTFNPFLSAGAGAGIFGGNTAAYAPLGVGFKLRFKEGAYLINQIQYRKALTDGITNDYLLYTVAFAQTLGKPKKAPETVKEKTSPVPADKDGDWFEDNIDECPDVAGKVKGCPDTDGDGVADKNDPCPAEKGTLNGCPDTDGDGIADKDDACPDAKGSVNGCPDADGDGVADKDDLCPDMKGSFKGCPDSDGDGIGDGEDKCPTVAGTTADQGCPEIKQEVKEKVEVAAKNIFFRFGSDVLLNRSLPPLKEVVTLLKKDPALQLVIEAHADSIGTAERNQLLSERRAKRVAQFFINSGIDARRISYRGYGATQPVADNATEKGRAQNRRVEMKLRY